MDDLIRRSALIKSLEPYGLSNGSSLGIHSGKVDIALQAIEKAPTIEQPTWISVEDRLPIESGKYLVIREYSAWERSLRDISIEYYSTEFEGWFFDGTKLLGVTHWMPLPELPKGG